MKPQDLITTYHKGIWRLKEVKDNIAYYTQEYNSAGEKIKGLQLKSCHIKFCAPVTEKTINQKINQLEQEINSWKKIKESLNS